jgi:hypothetical protein
VAADLGLVADASERHADELTPGRAAIDSPIEVFPVPGGPDEREDRAGALVVLDAALLAELLDCDVLDDCGP